MKNITKTQVSDGNTLVPHENNKGKGVRIKNKEVTKHKASTPEQLEKSEALK